MLADPYDPQQLNRYAYVRNNPVKYTDPSGNFGVLAAGLAIYGTLETASDIGSAGQSLVTLWNDPSLKNLATVGIDAISIADIGGIGEAGLLSANEYLNNEDFRASISEGRTGGILLGVGGITGKSILGRAAGEVVGRAANSRILGRNLEVSGFSRPNNSAAHHIVAGDADGAEAARRILQNAGIDINSSVNGVFLPKSTRYMNPPMSTHSTIHTKKYYDTLTERLSNVAPQDVEKELGSIRNEILEGSFPY